MPTNRRAVLIGLGNKIAETVQSILKDYGFAVYERIPDVMDGDELILSYPGPIQPAVLEGTLGWIRRHAGREVKVIFLGEVDKERDIYGCPVIPFSERALREAIERMDRQRKAVGKRSAVAS